MQRLRRKKTRRAAERGTARRPRLRFRREERAARNEAASETRTLRAVCARLAAAEKELEERRRVEAVQARAAEALTAENARLTAELSRLMAFVPEDALTDTRPTTTEKIEQ